MIPQYRPALIVAVAVIALELLTLSWLRSRFFGTGFLRSFVVSVAFGGAIIVASSATLGARLNSPKGTTRARVRLASERQRHDRVHEA